MLFRPPASRALFERLCEKSFGFSLTLPEQDEAVFVEFFSAGLGIDGGDADLDVPKVVHNLCDSHCSCLVHCRRPLARCPMTLTIHVD